MPEKDNTYTAANAIIGRTETIDPNATLIRLEVRRNENVMMWHMHGEVFNPDCRFVVTEGSRCYFIRNGRQGEIKNPGMYRVFPPKQEKRGLFGKKQASVEPMVIDLIVFADEYRISIPWGTNNRIGVQDPVANMPLHIGAFGNAILRIKDPQRFYVRYGQGTENYNGDAFCEELAPFLVNRVGECISACMKNNRWSFIHLSAHKEEIENLILQKANEDFNNEFGLEIVRLALLGLNLDDKKGEEKEYREKLDDVDAHDRTPIEGMEKPESKPVLPEGKVCRFCKTKNHPNASICHNCGAAL